MTAWSVTWIAGLGPTQASSDMIPTAASTHSRRGLHRWHLPSELWLLDYLCAGDRTLVLDTSQAFFLLPEVMGSDHCPVGAVLSVSTPLCQQTVPTSLPPLSP